MLTGKRIVLGVTGGIAAYKAVEVCRRLVDAGAHVVPVMTKAAERFVGRTTFSALASEPVQTELWNGPTPIPHTRLGQDADLVVVAPATARLISAYAHGPRHRPAHQHAARHAGSGAAVPGDAHRDVGAPGRRREPRRRCAAEASTSSSPAVGRLAGGDIGAGRLADPVDIVAAAERILGPGDLAGCDGRRHGRRDPGADRRRAGDRQPQLRQAGVRDRVRGRGPGRRVVLVSTVELPPPPDVDGGCRRDRRADGSRGDARERTPTSS